MKEEITPTRALWLAFVPLTFEELFNIITNINNKYIRSSLFFVAGFQKISKIRELSKNIIENNAFDIGLQATEYNKYRKENQITFYDNNNNFEFKEFSKDGISKFYKFIFSSEEESTKKLRVNKKIRLIKYPYFEKYKLDNKKINLIDISFNQKKAFDVISNKSNKYIAKSIF